LPTKEAPMAVIFQRSSLKYIYKERMQLWLFAFVETLMCGAIE
jgi:hypothetical protein